MTGTGTGSKTGTCSSRRELVCYMQPNGRRRSRHTGRLPAHFRPDGCCPFSGNGRASEWRQITSQISARHPCGPLRISYESRQIDESCQIDESRQIDGIIGRLPTSEFLPSRMAGV